MQPQIRKRSATNVRDDEWVFASSYLALMSEDAPRRRHDLGKVFAALRRAEGRDETPTPAICDRATRQLAPESGHRTGCDDAKRRNDSKMHLAGDTLGQRLALHVTPADAEDRDLGFVPLPWRRVVEHSFARVSRFHRLAKDHERLPNVVAGLHFPAFATLMPHRLDSVVARSPSQSLGPE